MLTKVVSNYTGYTDMKKWRFIHKTLVFKITASVSLCLAIIVLIVALVSSRMQENSSIKAIVRNARCLPNSLANSRSFCLPGDGTSNIAPFIEAAGETMNLQSMQLINKKGEIFFSYKAKHQSGLFDRTSQDCQVCHKYQPPLDTLSDSALSYITRKDPQSPRVLNVVSPVYFDNSCRSTSCHQSMRDTNIAAIAKMTISLQELTSRIADSNRNIAIFGVLIVIVLSVVVALCTRFFITRPISNLLSSTRAITQGEYGCEVKPISRDKIGELAYSFEQMRRSIKEKTEDLGESQKLFKTLFEKVPCYISVQDSYFRIVAANKMFERDFGQRLGELCYVAYKGRDSICPDCPVAKTLESGEIRSSEQTVIGQDGHPIHFLVLTAPIFDKDGNANAVIEMSTDVTAIRNLENELHKSEEKYRLFFNNDPSPIFVFDESTYEIMDINDRALNEYGIGKGDLIGRSFLEFTDPGEWDRIKKFIQSGKTFIYKVLQVRTDGTKFFVNLRASHGEYFERKAIIASTIDITEHLQAEQQLIQASKMATLGEMSAGIAHELNQPLSIIGLAGKYFIKTIDRKEQIDFQNSGRLPKTSWPRLKGRRIL